MATESNLFWSYHVCGNRNGNKTGSLQHHGDKNRSAAVIVSHKIDGGAEVVVSLVSYQADGKE